MLYYFDNAASTKVFKEAAQAALKVMTCYFANASSIHGFGLKSEKILNSCRDVIAKCLKCSSDEVIFTSGATESINLAIIGAAKKEKKRKKIITSSIEHSSTKNCLKHLKEKGYFVCEVAARNGRFFAEDFLKLVDEDCFLVSVMHVNNENGLILPVEEIAKKVKQKNSNVLVHVDAAQSFLKLPINLENIDCLSFSGHKFNAPKGVGCLIKKTNAKISPIFFGGGQEFGLRPGTQATALIAALDVAINKNLEQMEFNSGHYLKLKDVLIDRLKNNSNISYNFNECCAAYIVNVSVRGIKSQVLLQFLEKEGFIVSSGAACSKNKKNVVLQNLGYSEDVANSAIRISFSKENDEKSVCLLAENILLAEKTLIKKTNPKN